MGGLPAGNRKPPEGGIRFREIAMAQSSAASAPLGVATEKARLSSDALGIPE